MTDLAARLDRAITAEREKLADEISRYGDAYMCREHLDRYAALVAVRARLTECHEYADQLLYKSRMRDLTAEAERLLSGEAG